MYIQYCQW